MPRGPPRPCESITPTVIAVTLSGTVYSSTGSSVPGESSACASTAGVVADDERDIDRRTEALGEHFQSHLRVGNDRDAVAVFFAGHGELAAHADAPGGQFQRLAGRGR